MQQRLISLAYRNVRINWRHTLSALLSIVAAFFSIVFFEGYISNLVELYYDGYQARNMYGDYIIENNKAQTPQGRAEPFDFSVGKAEQSAINDFKKRHPELVAESVRFLIFTGLISNGQSSVNFYARSFDVNEGKVIRGPSWENNALYGKPLHLASNTNSLLIGMGLGQTLGCKPVKTFKIVTSTKGYGSADRPFECDTQDMQMSVSTESNQLNAMDFEVVGFVDGGYREVDNRYISMPLSAAQQLMNTEKVTYVTVLLKNYSDGSRFEKLFQEEVISQFPHLRAVHWQNHPVGEMYRKTLDLMSIFRNFVVVVIISITTLSVMNTTVKAIKERTREIGTLRSLGFEREDIRGIFMWESFFLSWFGIVLGGILSLLTSLIVEISGISYKAGILSLPVSFNVKVNLWAYLIAAFVLVVMGLVVTALVCQETLRKKIVENLGHV